MKKITLLALFVSAFTFMTAQDMDTTWVDLTDATAVANSVYNTEAQYEGIMAIDIDSVTNMPNLSTRWAANLTEEDGSIDNGWTVEITFPNPVTFDHIQAYDFKGRVDNFAIEVLKDDAMVEVFKGTQEKEAISATITLQTVKFDEAITTTKVLYRVITTVEKAPSVWSINLFSLNAAASAISSIAASEVKVYVSQSNLHIENSVAQETEIALYDISGRLAKKQNFNSANTSINIDGLKSGIYMVRLANESGVSATKVLVK